MKITQAEYDCYIDSGEEIEGQLNDFVNPYDEPIYSECKVDYTISKFKNIDVLAIYIKLTKPININGIEDEEKHFKITKSSIYESKKLTHGYNVVYPFSYKKPVENEVLRNFYNQKSKFIWAQFLKYKKDNTKTTLMKPQYRFIDPI
jgi:hypothetical protein